MGGRKKKHEKEPNHERWLVSYADFITLLFAFFVVMYSVSSLNEGRYRAMTSSLQAAFNGPPKRIAPIEIGSMSQNSIFSYAPELKKLGNEDYQKEASSSYFETLINNFKIKFQGLIKNGQLDIRETEEWIEVELKSRLLFKEGSAVLNEGIIPLLKELANVLKEMKAFIQIEGYTDSQPISDDWYPSNWELSSARASSVVRILISGGVPPVHLAATGYADNYPVSPNDTEEGRAENRRIIIVISKTPTRHERQDKAMHSPNKVLILKPISRLFNQFLIEHADEKAHPYWVMDNLKNKNDME